MRLFFLFSLHNRCVCVEVKVVTGIYPWARLYVRVSTRVHDSCGRVP